MVNPFFRPSSVLRPPFRLVGPFFRSLAGFRLAAVFGFLVLAACTHVFLQPDHADYFPGAAEKILYEEGFIPAPDGQKLHFWIVGAQIDKKKIKSKGLVVQVHGNAQNLTSHIRSIGWLTAAGYDVAIFDYRGYGKSTGSRDIDGAFQDVGTALDFFTTQKNPEHLPVFFYGQSLGGTLLLKSVSSQPGRWHPAMIVIESSFYGFSDIAREKLASWWLSWPFQWLAYLLVSDKYSLKDQELRTISPLPVYLWYSEHDPIVPIAHGDRVFRGLAEPKRFFSYPEPGHIAAMWVQRGRFRNVLIEEMALRGHTGP